MDHFSNLHTISSQACDPAVDPKTTSGNVERGSEGCIYLEKKVNFLISFSPKFLLVNGESHISKKPEFVLLQHNEWHILKALYGQLKRNHVELSNDWEHLF